MDPDILYQRYYSVIYQQILGCIRHPAQAEDLTQDTFIKAFGALDSAPQTPAELRRWLGCIARNTLIDYTRHVRRIAWEGICEESATTTSDLSESTALRLEVQAIWRELPAHSRQVLRAWLEGHTVAEMAALLGISPKVTKMRLYRARQQFKQRYLAGQVRETQEDREVARQSHHP